MIPWSFRKYCLPNSVAVSESALLLFRVFSFPAFESTILLADKGLGLRSSQGADLAKHEELL